MTTDLQKDVEAGLVKAGEVTDQIIPAMSKLVEKLGPAIATVSHKLGVGAEHLWTVLVKQTYNLAIGNGVIILFALIGLTAAFYGAGVWQKKIEKDDWSTEGWGGVIAIKAISGVIAIIVIATNSLNLVQRLINPEYYALQAILKYIN
jgi:hypothetical protein